MNFASTAVASSKLQVVLAAAKTTNDCPVVVHFQTQTGNRLGLSTMTSSPANQLSTTNGTAAVDVLTAAPTDQNLFVEGFSCYNADTGPTTVTVQAVTTTAAGVVTTTIIIKRLLQVGESLLWEKFTGWYVAASTFPTGRLTTLTAAGTLFNGYTTAKTILPSANVLSLAPNFWTVGKTMEIEFVAGLSNIVTTPGTLTLQVMVGAVIAFTTGAVQMSTTAHTLLPLLVKILLTCRSVGSGTSATLIGQARLEGQGVVEVSGADVVSNVGVVLAPLTAPAVGTGFDSTIANTLDLWNGFSINNAGNGIQLSQYVVNVSGG